MWKIDKRKKIFKRTVAIFWTKDANKLSWLDNFFLCIMGIKEKSIYRWEMCNKEKLKLYKWGTVAQWHRLRHYFKAFLYSKLSSVTLIHGLLEVVQSTRSAKSVWWRSVGSTRWGWCGYAWWEFRKNKIKKVLWEERETLDDSLYSVG